MRLSQKTLHQTVKKVIKLRSSVKTHRAAQAYFVHKGKPQFLKDYSGSIILSIVKKKMPRTWWKIVFYTGILPIPNTRWNRHYGHEVAHA